MLKKQQMHPSALLSSISMREFFKNMREVHRGARGTAECFSQFSSVLKNCQVLKIYNSTVNKDEVFYFFYKMADVKEIVRTQTHDVSCLHYNSIKHACDIDRILYGTIMNST